MVTIVPCCYVSTWSLGSLTSWDTELQVSSEPVVLVPCSLCSCYPVLLGTWYLCIPGSSDPSTLITWPPKTGLSTA